MGGRGLVAGQGQPSSVCAGSEVPMGHASEGKEGQCLLGAGVEEKYLRWRNTFGTQHRGPQAGADPHFVELNKLLRAQF